MKGMDKAMMARAQSNAYGGGVAKKKKKGARSKKKRSPRGGEVDSAAPAGSYSS